MSPPETISAPRNGPMSSGCRAVLSTDMHDSRSSIVISASLWTWLLLSAFTLVFACLFYADVSVAHIAAIFTLYQLAFALLVWFLIFERKLCLPTFSKWIPLSVFSLMAIAVYGLASY